METHGVFGLSEPAIVVINLIAGILIGILSYIIWGIRKTHGKALVFALVQFVVNMVGSLWMPYSFYGIWISAGIALISFQIIRKKLDEFDGFLIFLFGFAQALSLWYAPPVETHIILKGMLWFLAVLTAFAGAITFLLSGGDERT